MGETGSALRRLNIEDEDVLGRVGITGTNGAGGNAGAGGDGDGELDDEEPNTPNNEEKEKRSSTQTLSLMHETRGRTTNTRRCDQTHVQVHTHPRYPLFSLSW